MSNSITNTSQISQSSAIAGHILKKLTDFCGHYLGFIIHREAARVYPARSKETEDPPLHIYIYVLRMSIVACICRRQSDCQSLLTMNLSSLWPSVTAIRTSICFFVTYTCRPINNNEFYISQKWKIKQIQNNQIRPMHRTTSAWEATREPKGIHYTGRHTTGTWIIY